jgi:hypothetical protein
MDIIGFINKSLYGEGQLYIVKQHLITNYRRKQQVISPLPSTMTRMNGPTPRPTSLPSFGLKK